MNDKIAIWLQNADSTANAGSSLASSLYDLPVSILLSGELGAGKTTFLQGLARGLGIRQSVTSPTYALEQRYETSHGELLHVDLYRLNAPQAREILLGSDHHKGIRCIEWPERAERHDFGSCIRIALEDDRARDGRTLRADFEDIPLPSDEDVDSWQAELRLPLHIRAHCAAVASFALSIAGRMLERGRMVRMDALRKAALVHDLFRFVDFRDGASHIEFDIPPETAELWNDWRKRLPGLRHEAAIAAFLRAKGYDALASIAEVHGPHSAPSERTRTEQKFLYYADKRVLLDRIVTIEERFDDFRKRYGGGRESTEGKQWYDDAKHVEAELEEYLDADGKIP